MATQTFILLAALFGLLHSVVKFWLSIARASRRSAACVRRTIAPHVC